MSVQIVLNRSVKPGITGTHSVKKFPLHAANSTPRINLNYAAGRITIFKKVGDSAPERPRSRHNMTAPVRRRTVESGDAVGLSLGRQILIM